MTEAGAKLLADDMAGVARLQFYSIVTGDGTYDGTEDLHSFTALKSQRQETFLSSVEKASDTGVWVKAMVSNKDLTAGYRVREAGLMAVDTLNPSAPAVLYSIVTQIVDSGQEYGDYIPPYNGLKPSVITLEYIAAVDDSADITVTEGVGAYASAEDLRELASRVDELSTTGIVVSDSQPADMQPGDLLFKITG